MYCVYCSDEHVMFEFRGMPATLLKREKRVSAGSLYGRSLYFYTAGTHV